MKLLWCNGFVEMYAQLEGWGQSAIVMYALYCI